MLLRKWIITIILMLGFGGSAHADSSNTPTAQAVLDFTAAFSAAQKANTQYRIAVEAENAAQAHLWQAGLAFGPTAGLQFGYILDNKPMVTSMDFMGQPMSFEIAPNYYSGQLTVTQPIFTGFKLFSNWNMSTLLYQTAQASRQLAESQLYVDVTEAYYGLVVAQEMLNVTEDLLHQTEDHLTVVQARFREGSASNYELLRSEVQLANLKPALLQARNGVALSRSKLALTIGRPATEWGLPTAGIPIVETTLPSQSELIAKALANRLELRNMDRARSLADIGFTLAAASNLPSLALTGSWTYYDTADQQYPPLGKNLLHSWQVMLGLSWPFWDNLSAIPKAVEANAKVRQAQLGRQALEDGIRLEVEANYLSWMAAREILSAQQKTIEQAEAGSKIATQQYAQGMMTNMDVLDAQLALNQAKTNFLQTQFSFVLARVKLLKAIGEPLVP